MQENDRSDLNSVEEEEFSEEDDFDPLTLKVKLNSDKNMLSPEDIANDAFSRIFGETNFKINEERRLFFNQEGEATTGHVYLKSFLCQSSGGKKQRASRSEQCSPKRHKSPASRHAPSIHSPFVKRRLLRWESLNSIRKTKSSASPTIPKTKWMSRGVTASTPDLKMVDRNIGAGFSPGNNERVYSRRENHISYRMCYYNLQLCNIILNCIIVAIGLIYFSCATAIISNKEIFLIMLNHQVYVFSLFSLYSISIILLVLAISRLCFTHQSAKKMMTNAFAALFVAAILVSLAFFENSTETKIVEDAESQMLSTIQYRPMSRFKEVWDYLHEKLKCCGVRGYLDWCIKENFVSKKNLTGKEFLGSLVCTPPSSCCLDYKSDSEENYSNQRHALCLQSPTPWNSYQIGCISPVKSEMHFLGKMYRITNIGLAIILMLSATLSVIQFTHI